MFCPRYKVLHMYEVESIDKNTPISTDSYICYLIS